jgi:hypothetical protein
MKDENTFLTDHFLTKVENFSKTSFELMKLKAINKVADSSANIINYFVVIFILSLIFISLNMGLSLFLNQIYKNNYSGFFMVAGINVIILILYYLLYPFFKNKFKNSIIEKLAEIK